MKIILNISNMNKCMCKHLQRGNKLVNIHCLHNDHIKVCGCVKAILLGTSMCNCVCEEILLMKQLTIMYNQSEIVPSSKTLFKNCIRMREDV